MQNIKKIIGFLCSLAFCTAIAAGIPKMARAAELTINATNFPDDIFREYVTENFDTDKNGKLSDVEIKDIISIDVSSKGIKSLKGVKYFTDLTYLSCGDNQLPTLDVSKNTALTVLGCGSNKLSDLDVSKNTKLTELYCGGNRLSDLDVSKNIKLTYLECSYGQLTSLNLNTALTDLECPYNGLTGLDLSKNMALEHLDCSDNQLTDLDISKNTKLTYLECSNNQLTNLDISKNIKLIDLGCGNNKLTNLDASKNTALTYLFCPDNQLTELKLNSQTYDILPLYTGYLHAPYVNLSDLQNVTITDDSYVHGSCIKVTDITKPGTYTVDGKDFTIIYADTVILPMPSPSAAPTGLPTQTPATSSSPSVISGFHIFNDYNYSNPVTDGSIVIYGNGMTKTVDGKKVNNRVAIVYTDIAASYKYTENDKGIVKTSVGKVIAGITTSATKPEVNSKNKITDTSASKIAKAKIKNGQITINTVGKEGGTVYLWVIDTGNKGVSACCPVNVKLLPKKLEIQDMSGSKLAKNTGIKNGGTLDVCVAGFVDSTKVEDGTYTATVDSKYSSYITVAPIAGSTDKFKITATGLKNNKKTKVTVTFKCDQNNKKTKLSLNLIK